MTTNEVIDILTESVLFRGCDAEEIRELVRNSGTLRKYEQGEFIFAEEDAPVRIRMLISGALLVAKDTVSGKRMILTKIDEPGDLFGEIYPFIGLTHYDMYVEALKDSRVLSISLEPFRMTGNAAHDRMAQRLQGNLLSVVARKAYQMNRRLRVVGSPGICGKIARLLVDLQNAGNRIRVMPREEMADYLTVSRPALSRELGNMVREGILKIDGRDLVILDQEALEEYL